VHLPRSARSGGSLIANQISWLSTKTDFVKSAPGTESGETAPKSTQRSLASIFYQAVYCCSVLWLCLWHLYLIYQLACLFKPYFFYLGYWRCQPFSYQLVCLPAFEHLAEFHEELLNIDLSQASLECELEGIPLDLNSSSEFISSFEDVSFSPPDSENWQSNYFLFKDKPAGNLFCLLFPGWVGGWAPPLKTQRMAKLLTRTFLSENLICNDLDLFTNLGCCGWPGALQTLQAHAGHPGPNLSGLGP